MKYPEWMSHIGKKASRVASLEFFRYIGPGFFVAVGFIDPGNWVTNVAAGSRYGYTLLWVVSLSTLILIIVQHNSAHLGIVTGNCLSEAVSLFFKPWLRFIILGTAMIACIATALAELLGAAIGLNMLTGIPLTAGALLTAVLSGWMLFSRSYQRLENCIIGFVSLIGLAFILELWLADVSWSRSLKGLVTPELPPGALGVVMGVLGAVVMPHNIFLHSEVVQSREWNLQGDNAVRKRLKYEFLDTLTGMGAGMAINSAMIIMAAAAFYSRGINITELSQVSVTLEPIFGPISSVVFALGLLFAGFSSSITAAMAGGSVLAGMFREPFDTRDPHSRAGVFMTLAGALAVILFLGDPFRGILWSQIALSLQLPFTILPLICLTSSEKVMGVYANKPFGRAVLYAVAATVIALNAALLADLA